MLFAPKDERFLYTRSPLVEVICQLRFPTILTISAKEPAEFQEAIRGEYPQFAARQEFPLPKVNGVGTPNANLQPQAPVTNYNFVSADGKWKVNLTADFIALSTMAYTRWEEFAQRLDILLAHFIRIYQPAWFERMGLRYLNAFSRKAVGMEGLLWDDLIRSQWLGILEEPDVDEAAVTKCSVDVDTLLSDGCRLKVHAGPGMIRKNIPGQAAPGGEARFILDCDVSTNGKLEPAHIPAKLEDMHTWADRLFRGSITRELHDAMGPLPL